MKIEIILGIDAHVGAVNPQPAQMVIEDGVQSLMDSGMLSFYILYKKICFQIIKLILLLSRNTLLHTFWSNPLTKIEKLLNK